MKQFKLMSLALLGIAAFGQICAAAEGIHHFESVPVLQARVNAGDDMGALAIAKNFLSGVDIPVHIEAEEIAVEKIRVFNWLSQMGDQGCLSYSLAYLSYMPTMMTSCPEEDLVRLRHNTQRSVSVLQSMFTVIDAVREEPIYPYFEDRLMKSLEAAVPVSQIPVRQAATWLARRRNEIADQEWLKPSIAQNVLRSLDSLIRASYHEDGGFQFGEGDQVTEMVDDDFIPALLDNLDAAVEQLYADADRMRALPQDGDGSSSDDEGEFEVEEAEGEGAAQGETAASWTFYNLLTVGGRLDFWSAAPVAQGADEGGADAEGEGSGDEGGVDPQFVDAEE